MRYPLTNEFEDYQVPGSVPVASLGAYACSRIACAVTILKDLYVCCSRKVPDRRNFLFAHCLATAAPVAPNQAHTAPGTTDPPLLYLLPVHGKT